MGTWCNFCGKTDCWGDPPCPQHLAYQAKERVRDAAPDLLAALKALRTLRVGDLCKLGCEFHSVSCIYRVVDAAITKATVA